MNPYGKFYANLEDDSLTIYSTYFEYELQHWFNYDDRKSTFLDIGANRGRYSIQALNLLNYKKAICFELLSVNLNFIQRNIELNNLKNKIIVYNVGLSNKEKEVDIYFDPLNTGISSLGNYKGKIKEKIKLKTLDSLMRDGYLYPKEISFIKIDVEGHEYEVLTGGINFFRKLSKDTWLMIEIWEHNRYKKNKTLRILSDLGFVLIEKMKNNYLFIKK